MELISFERDVLIRRRNFLTGFLVCLLAGIFLLGLVEGMFFGGQHTLTAILICSTSAGAASLVWRFPNKIHLLTLIALIITICNLIHTVWHRGMTYFVSIGWYILPVVAAFGVGTRAATITTITTISTGCFLIVLHELGIIAVGEFPLIMSCVCVMFSTLVMGALSIFNARAMNERLKELHELISAKDQFLNNISHEIRTPLVGILSTSELLHSRSPTEPLSEILVNSSVQVLHVVNQILSMSTLNHSGGKAPAERAFHLPKVIVGAFNMLKAKAEAESINYTIDIDESAKLVCLGCDSAIVQAFGNLLGNAVKFSDSDVKVRVYTSGDVVVDSIISLHLEVEDDGCGISESDQTRIWLPFEQLQTHQGTGGTGLGLSICKTMIEKQLSGTVDVESEVGSGSTFKMVVPLRVVERSNKQTSPQVSSVDLSQLKFDGKFVVLVDDNIINRKVFTRQIEALGCKAAAVADRAQLEALLCDESVDIPDCLFLDLHLQQGDTGVKVCKYVKETLNYRKPIVGFSASVAGKQLCLNAGMNSFLSKPVTLSKLSDVLIAIKL